MKKIIDKLKNGTGYEKRFALLTILSALASAGLGAAFALTRQMLCFFGTVSGIFSTAALKLTLDLAPPEDEKKLVPLSESEEEEEEAPDEPYSDQMNADTVQDKAEQKHRRQHSTEPKAAKLQDVAPKQTSVANTDENSDMWADINDKFAEYDYDDAYYDDDDETDKTVKKKRTKQKKQKVRKPKVKKPKIKMPKAKMPAADEELDMAKSSDDSDLSREERNSKYEKYIGKRVGDVEEQETKKLIVFRPASDEEIESYDKKKIKHTLHEYKVKRDNRKVLVDRSDKYKIKQTPAYIWVTGKEFHMLLIEEEPRHVIIPVHSIREISYLKKQPVNADTDYPAFHRKNLFTDLFRPCLPDYTYNTVAGDMNSYKNLYGILGDIYFTNNSAKHLFDLLGVKFRVDDKVTMSPKVNFFFKDAYKSNILLRDGVIDANGYADRISDTLDAMARSSIGFNEFKDTLDLMIRNKLITTEFANHYIDVREKYKLG